MPFVPDWPGAGAIEIVHSAAYRNASLRTGDCENGPVVGTGNSGAEIAVDLAEEGADQVLLSVRTPPGIVRRDTAGVPSQLFGTSRRGTCRRASRDRIAATIRRIADPRIVVRACPLPSGPTRRSSSGA